MKKRFTLKPGARDKGAISAGDLCHSESSTQIAVMAWLERQHPRAFEVTHHSPNGEKRDEITGRKLKRMGTKKGFPDLITYQPAKLYTGLVVELKEDNGVLSDDQDLWLRHFERLRYFVAVPVGFDQCVAVFDHYLQMVEWP